MTEDQMSRRIEAWGKLGSAALIAILFGGFIWLSHDIQRDAYEVQKDFNEKMSAMSRDFNDKMSESIRKQADAIERGAAALTKLAEDAAKD